MLLDALGALRQQLDAVVLVGAQAVYLRTADRLPAYQPFTTDADIAEALGQIRTFAEVSDTALDLRI